MQNPSPRACLQRRETLAAKSLGPIGHQRTVSRAGHGVFVNAGMPATFETLKLAREFDRIGVTGIAVITPFFIACTQDGLIRHFSTVADAVTTPVYLYDIPARTQNHIEPETARRLAGHGNIAGIKDSGGARETLEAYLQVAKDVDGFEVYSGPDHLVLWALQNGAAGCISGH